MSALKSSLSDDVKQALKSGDKTRVGTLRMVLAAIKQREVDDRVELDD
ncbi:MAG: GatB/YqeY domain-containing protein, partial [Gammaproteobacteria bacterium]|nr:GatB/YqeY domain-containing protein [Gammaproteobacteria bacterium]